MPRMELLNIEIDNISLRDAVKRVKNTIIQEKKIYVVTPNVDHIVKIESNREFAKAYKDASLVLVDGTPLMWIAKINETPLIEKITGPRFAESVIKMAADNGYSVFFLGGMPGVAEKAERNMKLKFGNLISKGCYSPCLGFEDNIEEINRIVSRINEANPDILVAGMGTPKTEIFLNNYIEKMNIHVAMSVGAAIDFMAGTVKRCPTWINRIGMEWFYRFIKEPKRMAKRYFVDDVRFVSIVRKYKRKRRKEKQ